MAETCDAGKNLPMSCCLIYKQFKEELQIGIGAFNFNIITVCLKKLERSD
jgi:hypothetical protein